MSKQLVLILLALLPLNAFAALRGTTSTYSQTAASSFSITYAGAGNIQTGDIIVLITNEDAGGSVTFTDPSGFTAGSSLSPALADILMNSSSQLHIAVKIATSGDDGTPTYVTTSNFSGTYGQQLRVYYGRVNSSIGAAFDNQVHTAAGTTGATPYSYSMTGLTALTGDDMVVIAGADISAVAGSETYSASLSGFGNLLVSSPSSTNDGPAIFSLDYQNHPSGATGALGVSLTSSPPGADLTPAGFVLSLPSSGGGGGTPPSQFFLGASLWQQPVSLEAMAR